MPFPKGAKRGPDGRLVPGSAPEEPPAGPEPSESGGEGRRDGGTTLHGPAASGGTAVARRPAAPPKGKRSWDAPVTQAEVQTACLHLCVVLSRVFGSTAEWELGEFEQLARGFVSLSNRLPVLRLIVVLITPLSVIGEAFEKARKLRAAIPSRRPRPQEQRASA